jgi:hypothetical protein
MDGDEFSSYCVKTTLMWMLEETLPARWESEDPLVLVKELYSRLGAFLDRGHIPYYFIPSINVLAEYPPPLVGIVRQRVHAIVGDLLGHLPDEAEVKSLAAKSDILLAFVKEQMPSIIQYFVEKRIRDDLNRTREMYEETIGRFFGRSKPNSEEPPLD